MRERERERERKGEREIESEKNHAEAKRSERVCFVCFGADFETVNYLPNKARPLDQALNARHSQRGNVINTR